MVMGTMVGLGMMKGHRVLDPGGQGREVQASDLVSFCLITTPNTYRDGGYTKSASCAVSPMRFCILVSSWATVPDPPVRVLYVTTGNHVLSMTHVQGPKGGWGRIDYH